MLPITKDTHTIYKHHVVKQLSIHFPKQRALDKASRTILHKFYRLDLSQVDAILAPKYSARGPVPRQPSSMLRALLLALALHINSITDMVSKLHQSPFFSILCGFSPDDVPGVGTFYDFINRLWDSNEDNFSPHEHKPKRKKVKIPDKKGDKAESVEGIPSEQLLRSLVQNPPSAEQPYSTLFNIFQIFLKKSASLNLLNLENLSLAGDGMPIITSVRGYSRRTCHCHEKGITDCNCNRYYPQPDCDWGWDSSRGKYYFGYDLYMFADVNHGLPVFPRLEPASHHDLMNFIRTWFTFRSVLPELGVKNLILDSAHDAMPVYQYFLKSDTNVFIDLRSHKTEIPLKEGFTVNENGRPVCPCGFPLYRDGTEHSRMRLKYRCPKLNHKKEIVNCPNLCTKSPYGPVIHIACKDNPRIFTIPARDSKQWKDMYKHRTAVERSNKREKIDYQIENGRHHSTKMWYCRLYCIMMLQHLDAWELPDTLPPKTKLLAA